MNEWKSIKTAPKDGTDFIGWFPTNIVPGSRGIMRTVRWDKEEGLCFRTNVYPFLQMQPTKWMPLPEPPK